MKTSVAVDTYRNISGVVGTPPPGAPAPVCAPPRAGRGWLGILLALGLAGLPATPAQAEGPLKPASAPAPAVTTATRKLLPESAPGEGQANLNTLRPEEGWRMVYASVPGRAPLGSLHRLLELIKTQPENIAVTVPVFHGNLSGYCQSIAIRDGNVIDCELKIWCTENGLGAEIPDRHGHSLHVLSDGTLNHVVLALTPRLQEKIVAMENSEVTAAFFLRQTPPAQTP